MLRTCGKPGPGVYGTVDDEIKTVAAVDTELGVRGRLLWELRVSSM